MAQVYGLKICHIQYMEELCTNINLKSGLYGTGLWTQNSSYPVYRRGQYLKKSHTWVICYRSLHSNLVIFSIWKRSVLKEISDLGCMAQLWTQNSSYPVYGRGLYLHKSQISVVWHRSGDSNFVISSTRKRPVLK